MSVPKCLEDINAIMIKNELKFEFINIKITDLPIFKKNKKGIDDFINFKEYNITDFLKEYSVDGKILIDCCLFFQIIHFNKLKMIGFGPNMSWNILNLLPKEDRPTYFCLDFAKLDSQKPNQGEQIYKCLSIFSSKGQWLAKYDDKYLGMASDGPKFETIEWWHTNILDSLNKECLKHKEHIQSKMINCYIKMDVFKFDNFHFIDKYKH